MLRWCGRSRDRWRQLDVGYLTSRPRPLQGDDRTGGPARGDGGGIPESNRLFQGYEPWQDTDLPPAAPPHRVER